MDRIIQQLARGKTGKNLLEVLEDVKRRVADIRTPLKVPGEIENAVRLGVIEALDSFLVEKLKIYAGDINEPDPNEHI